MAEIPLDAIWVGLENTDQEDRYIHKKIEQIGSSDIFKAIEQAAEARSNSPLDELDRVGVGILIPDRRVYAGHNKELFREFPGITQATGMAIRKALNGGAEKLDLMFIHCISIVQDSSLVTSLDHLSIAQPYAKNSLVVCANQNGKITTITSLGAIFPDGQTRH